MPEDVASITIEDLGTVTAVRLIDASTHAVLRTLEVSGLDTYLPMSRSMSDALNFDVAEKRRRSTPSVDRRPQ